MDYVTFPFEKFVSCITTEYDVQADSILALYIEIAKYLRDNPILSDLTVKEIIDKYLEENLPSAGVVSVNGKTGVVTGLYSAENPPPYPVTSVNGKTGDVTIQEGGGGVSGVSSINGKTGAITGVYTEENPPPYPVSSVNGKTGVVTGLYSAENPPPYPVSSVNGKTGVVTGLYSAENPPPYPVSSVNGKTGTVTGLYSAENPPPYPVASVDGKTGSITSIIAISGPESTENEEYSITIPPRTCCILMSALNPFTTAETTLPAGNEDGITLEGDGFYPGELIAGYFNRGYIMCKESYSNATKSIFNYKNFGSSPYYLKYGFNILLVNGRSVESRLTIKGYY